MKNIFFLVAFGAAILLFGCKENSINNPVSPDTSNKPAFANSTTLNGTINLDQKLINPGRFGGDVKLTGTIYYTEEILKQNPLSTSTSYDAKIDISIDAYLIDENSSTGTSDTWKIKNASENRVNVTATEPDDLVKTYTLQGTPQGMKLVCTFSITTDGVKLKNAVLQSPEV
jgi:hypothetical protein